MTAEVNPPTAVIEITNRFGVNIAASIFDIHSRRHLMPTLMDEVPISSHRCACPGPRNAEAPCLLKFDSTEDRMCAACCAFCWDIDPVQGEQLLFINAFGPAIPPQPGEIFWAPVGKMTRVHAFAEECRGCHNSLEEHLRSVVPFSLCRQAWGTSWTQVKTVTSAADIPKCKTCIRLADARVA